MRLSLLEQLSTDLRHNLRVLRNAPAFTAVAILSLALGIGAHLLGPTKSVRHEG